MWESALSSASAADRPRRGADGSAVLLALGAGLVTLLWLIEVLGDPTDGFAFYALIFGAPLLMAIGLVLLAWQKEVAGNAGRAGAILTLVGALFPDIIGFSLA